MQTETGKLKIKWHVCLIIFDVNFFRQLVLLNPTVLVST